MDEEAKILNSAEWGGDLEVRLLAIGLQRDIVVITSGVVGSYARRFPHEAPPLPKMYFHALDL